MKYANKSHLHQCVMCAWNGIVLFLIYVGVVGIVGLMVLEIAAGKILSRNHLNVLEIMYLSVVYGFSVLHARHTLLQIVSLHRLAIKTFLINPIFPLVIMAFFLSGIGERRGFVLVSMIAYMLAGWLGLYLMVRNSSTVWPEGDPICVECGYNLKGNISDKCPECGMEVVSS